MLVRIIVVVLFFKAGVLYGQPGNNHLLSFHPLFGKSDSIFEGGFFKLDTGDSIQFETLKFYVSGIELLSDGSTTWKEENSFHLMDVTDANSLSLSNSVPVNAVFNQIKFNIGIDSITNVSGAMGGDLDPTRGMYWTWQNGYINFKLEGKSNLCKTRNNEFQFHLGGYQHPFSTLQTFTFNTEEKDKIDIVFDIEKLIKSIDLAGQNHIMSPCSEAVQLSDKLQRIFSIR